MTVRIAIRDPETKRKRRVPVDALVESTHFAVHVPHPLDVYWGKYVITHKDTGIATLMNVRTLARARTALKLLEDAGDDWSFTSFSKVKDTEQWGRCRQAARAAQQKVDPQ